MTLIELPTAARMAAVRGDVQVHLAHTLSIGAQGAPYCDPLMAGRPLEPRTVVFAQGRTAFDAFVRLCSLREAYDMLGAGVQGERYDCLVEAPIVAPAAYKLLKRITEPGVRDLCAAYIRLRRSQEGRPGRVVGGRGPRLAYVVQEGSHHHEGGFAVPGGLQAPHAHARGPLRKLPR